MNWLNSIAGKTKVKIAALGAFFTLCAGYVFQVPTEYQDRIIRELQDVLPESSRAWVGHALHLLAYGCIAYGMIHASKTGPHSEPANDPDDK